MTCKCHGPWRREVITVLIFGALGRAHGRDWLSELLWKTPGGVGSPVRWQRGMGLFHIPVHAPFSPSLPIHKVCSSFGSYPTRAASFVKGAFSSQWLWGHHGPLVGQIRVLARPWPLCSVLSQCFPSVYASRNSEKMIIVLRSPKTTGLGALAAVPSSI